MDVDTTAHGSGRRVGTVTMVAGSVVIVGALASEVTEWAWLAIMLGIALLIYCVPKLHALQGGADGWAGTAGTWLVLAGAGVITALALVYVVWEAIGEPDEPGWLGALWMIAFLAFALGVISFSVGAVMSRRFGAVGPVLMLVGIVAGLGIDMATGAFFEEDAATTPWGLYIGMTLLGLGLISVGYTVRGRRASQQPLPA